MLARVPLFAGLDPGELEVLARHTRHLTFEEGSIIVREDTRGPRVLAFFVIVSGTATVSLGGDPLRQLEPGDYFGEIALLRETTRTATVTATTDLTCLGLSASDFRSCLESMPQIAVKLLEELARRVDE